MNILLVDNYDSFTFNIVELLRSLLISNIIVKKNDEISVQECHSFSHIIISPGPSVPSESGIILSLIKELAPTHPILGICLGHQAIAQAFGATLINMPNPQHGLQTLVELKKTHSIFNSLPKKFKVGLYHSWLVSSESLPDSLYPTSFTKTNQIMSLKHSHFNCHGVQFHPESYMTENGGKMMQNFLLNKE